MSEPPSATVPPATSPAPAPTAPAAAAAAPEAAPADRTRAPIRSDARAMVALAGPVLLTPTALVLADRPWSLFGVPSVLLYVFGVWLAGIALTYLLAGRAR